MSRHARAHAWICGLHPVDDPVRTCGPFIVVVCVVVLLVGRGLDIDTNSGTGLHRIYTVVQESARIARAYSTVLSLDETVLTISAQVAQVLPVSRSQYLGTRKAPSTGKTPFLPSFLPTHSLYGESPSHHTVRPWRSGGSGLPN